MAISLSTGPVSLWDRKRGRQATVMKGRRPGTAWLQHWICRTFHKQPEKPLLTCHRETTEGKWCDCLHLCVFPNRTCLNHAVQVPLLGGVCPRSPWGPLSFTVRTLHTVILTQTLILKLISGYQGSPVDFMQIYFSHSSLRRKLVVRIIFHQKLLDSFFCLPSTIESGDFY